MKIFGRQFPSKTKKVKLWLVITSVAHDLSGPSKLEAEMSEASKYFHLVESVALSLVGWHFGGIHVTKGQAAKLGTYIRNLKSLYGW